MSGMALIDELYGLIVAEINALKAENADLRRRLKDQQEKHAQELKDIRANPYRDDGKGQSSTENLVDIAASNFSTLNHIPALPYISVSPTKRRSKRTVVKQEREPVRPTVMSEAVSTVVKTEPFSQIKPRCDFIIDEADVPQPLYFENEGDSEISSENGDGVEDSEFARLPTQYSDQSNLSPIKSPARSQLFQSSPLKKNSNIEENATETPSNLAANMEIEVIDDSDEDHDLLLPPQQIKLETSEPKIKSEPLADITNIVLLPGTTLKERKSKRTRTKSASSEQSNASKNKTPLQMRDSMRDFLKDQFENNPLFHIVVNDEHPIYQQRWQISDFIPNPNYTRANLKRRKMGKTRKEQEEIDRFYKLAGPGIQLKSIKWDQHDMQADDEVGDKIDDVNNSVERQRHVDRSAHELSQFYGRFPSPPGFNEVDFPTTQEELERRIETERKQSSRVHSRITECLKVSGSYLFREDILNQFVSAGRITVDKRLSG